MKTFRFLQFKVYKDAKNYFKTILIISERVKNYSFRDQIRRASLSIMLNIAEGSAKKSDIEFARFLEISIGSLNEVVACLNIMNELKKLSDDEYNKLLNISEELAKQLGGEVVREDGNVLLATLPASSYAKFKKELAQIGSSPVFPKATVPKEMKDDLSLAAGAKSKEPISIRIHLVPE